MIRSFIVSILLISLYACSPQVRPATIESVTRTQVFENVMFAPSKVEQTLSSDLLVTVTPLDVNAVNSISLDNSSLSGSYDKSRVSVSYYEERIDSEDLTKSDRVKFRKELAVLKAIKSLLKNNTISEKIAEAFYSKLLNPSIGITTPDIEIQGTGIITDRFNPYKKDGKNFSVFQIDFVNPSSTNATFDSKDVIVSSGFEQLYPYSNTYLSQLHEGDVSKIDITNRINLPTELVVPSQGQVRKFIAIPPLDVSTEELKIQFVDEETTRNFNFRVKSLRREESVTLNKYKFTAEEQWKYNTEKFLIVVEQIDGAVYPLEGNELYKDRSLLAQAMNIYAFELGGTDFSFGLKKDLKLNENSSSNIEIHFYDRQSYDEYN